MRDFRVLAIRSVLNFTDGARIADEREKERRGRGQGPPTSNSRLVATALRGTRVQQEDVREF